jgi:hypothetical protein
VNRRDFLRYSALAAAAAGLGSGAGIGLSQLDARTRSAVRRFRSRPDLRPPVPLITRRGATAPGLVFTAPMGGPGSLGPLILEESGEPVWVRPSPAGLAQLDFRAQTYRGKPVLTWWQGRVAKGWGRGEYVLLDSSYRELTRVRAGNGLHGDLHEFELTPDGTALITAYDTVDHGGRKVVDGVVQEVDVASGEVVFQWRSLDHVPLVDSYRPRPARPATPFDYIHLNSVSLDLDGNLLVSGRHTCTIYKVDRRSGAVLWRLGGKRSDFPLRPGVRTWFQHDVRRDEDGTLTIFDNGSTPDREPLSRALTLSLDEPRRRAAVLRADTHPGVLARAMGSVQRLPDLGLFVGWGTEPYASEFAPDGSLVYDVRMPDGGISYRAFRLPWVGRPSERPSVALDGDRVHVSWNGATEVAAWRAFVDGRPGDAALRTGFETEIRLARPGGRRVEVAAYDASGAEIGRSHPAAL